jgi:peptidoglycan-associated lipoprotein
MQLNQKSLSEKSSGADAAAAEAARQAEATRVFFDGDSTAIRDDYIDLIRNHAERFNTGPGGTLIVSGHANPVEDPEEAVALSMDRTHAVATLLEKFGVQSHRIVRVSHGANAPIADAADKQANWANRCVEIRHGSLTPRQPVWSQRSRKTAPKR